MSRQAIFWCLSIMLLLPGCQKQIELHRNLSETDANEVIAELASKNIVAQKQLAKEGVSVTIATSDMARAVKILEAAGLPHESRRSLGEIFQKDGVISTPLEERARYIYALSQELESTLSSISGVVVARVHVVLPERIAPGEPVQPASAAVFIKHRPELDPDAIRPRIQRMVLASIPGLSTGEDKLAIVFVPAEVYQDQQVLTHFGPFLIPTEAKAGWQRVIIFSIIGLILLLAAGVLLLRPEWARLLMQMVGLSKPDSSAAAKGATNGPRRVKTS